MTKFIHQEALEKAKEIQIKADEEFAIEKSQLVRTETGAIDAQYDKKFKQAAMSQQITRSTLANRTRLRVLAARQALLDRLFERARGRCGEVTRDKGRYQTVARDLVLEGLYALNEPRLLVRARKPDAELVRKAAEQAAAEFKKQLGKEVKVELDEKNPLPEES